MKCVVAAIVWAAGCVNAQADVYKWTDSKGEVHYGEFPTQPNPRAEKVMTQEQIQQVETADKVREQAEPQPSSPDNLQQTLNDLQNRDKECQRYKNLRDDRLLNTQSPVQAYEFNRYGLYGLGNVQQTINVEPTMGMNEILAGIQKYCQ